MNIRNERGDMGLSLAALILMGVVCGGMMIGGMIWGHKKMRGKKPEQSAVQPEQVELSSATHSETPIHQPHR
jgi:hypothetical protein